MNKGMVKDLLPQEPLAVALEPWWVVHVVNVGEAEYRSLDPGELAACHVAARPGGARCAELHPAAVGTLYRRGLVWLDVPVRPEDHLSIPPLEGFVSNKTTAAGATDADPVEGLLYQIFVAASDRVTVAKLASILNVDVPTLSVAISVACRLRFCRRLDAEEGPGGGSGPGGGGLGGGLAAAGLPPGTAAQRSSTIEQLDIDHLLRWALGVGRAGWGGEARGGVGCGARGWGWAARDRGPAAATAVLSPEQQLGPAAVR